MSKRLGCGLFLLIWVAVFTSSMTAWYVATYLIVDEPAPYEFIFDKPDPWSIA